MASPKPEEGLLAMRSILSVPALVAFLVTERIRSILEVPRRFNCLSVCLFACHVARSAP